MFYHFAIKGLGSRGEERLILDKQCNLVKKEVAVICSPSRHSSTVPDSHLSIITLSQL